MNKGKDTEAREIRTKSLPQRVEARFLIILTIVVIASIALALVAYVLTEETIIQSFSTATLAAIIAVVTGLVIAILATTYTARLSSQSRLRYEETYRRLLKLTEDQERQSQLIALEKQRFELEKRQFDLEKQEQSLGWQKEAIMLADISPRAAILIAWMGIEQQIQRAVTSVNVEKGTLPEPSNKMRIWGSSKIDQLLVNNKVISPETARTLIEMRNQRNRLAHDIEGEEVSEDIAVDYLQRAIHVAEEISSSLKK